jgi:hypothetical protein
LIQKRRGRAEAQAAQEKLFGILSGNISTLSLSLELLCELVTPIRGLNSHDDDCKRISRGSGFAAGSRIGLTTQGGLEPNSAAKPGHEAP